MAQQWWSWCSLFPPCLKVPRYWSFSFVPFISNSSRGCESNTTESIYPNLKCQIINVNGWMSLDHRELWQSRFGKPVAFWKDSQEHYKKRLYDWLFSFVLFQVQIFFILTLSSNILWTYRKLLNILHFENENTFFFLRPRQLENETKWEHSVPIMENF